MLHHSTDLLRFVHHCRLIKKTIMAEKTQEGWQWQSLELLRGGKSKPRCYTSFIALRSSRTFHSIHDKPFHLCLPLDGLAILSHNHFVPKQRALHVLETTSACRKPPPRARSNLTEMVCGRKLRTLAILGHLHLYHVPKEHAQSLPAASPISEHLAKSHAFQGTLTSL